MRKLGMSGHFFIMEEIWKPVMSYEGLYEVSNLGNLKSCRKGVILNKTITKLGYIRNKLVNSLGIRKNIFLHRLVAINFIPNPENYKVVMHLDNNKLNCNVNNLRWDTQKNNIIHMYQSNNNLITWKGKSVLQYTKEGEFIQEWESASLAGKTLGINQGNISSNIKGLHNYSHTGGFIWKFK